MVCRPVCRLLQTGLGDQQLLKTGLAVRPVCQLGNEKIGSKCRHNKLIICMSDWLSVTSLQIPQLHKSSPSTVRFGLRVLRSTEEIEDIEDMEHSQVRNPAPWPHTQGNKPVLLQAHTRHNFVITIISVITVLKLSVSTIGWYFHINCQKVTCPIIRAVTFSIILHFHIYIKKMSLSELIMWDVKWS